MLKKILATLAVVVLVFGNTSLFACKNGHQEKNKKIVSAFYEAALNQKNYSVAEKYLSKNYIQHNPNVADGKAGLKAYIDYLRQNFPQSHGEVKRIFADGEYVILHVRSLRAPDAQANAMVDIFRLDNGKIVEHWDVVQAVPANLKNNNGMF